MQVKFITGRKFMCVGKNEIDPVFRDKFNIGSVYFEIESYIQHSKQNLLCLLTKKDETVIVKSYDFVEVDKENQLIRVILKFTEFSEN